MIFCREIDQDDDEIKEVYRKFVFDVVIADLSDCLELPSEAEPDRYEVESKLEEENDSSKGLDDSYREVFTNFWKDYGYGEYKDGTDDVVDAKKAYYLLSSLLEFDPVGVHESLLEGSSLAIVIHWLRVGIVSSEFRTKGFLEPIYLLIHNHILQFLVFFLSFPQH